MGNSEDKIIDLGSPLRLHESEMKYLRDFFNCKSLDDLVRAFRRYEDMFLSRDDIHPINVGSSLVLALSLASELYVDFDCLDKPLTNRYPEKQNGIKRKERKIPDDILKIIQNEKEKTDWAKEPNQIDIIKRLQRQNILQSDLEASTLEKDIQELARREAHLKEVFKDIKPENCFKSKPE